MLKALLLLTMALAALLPPLAPLVDATPAGPQPYRQDPRPRAALPDRDGRKWMLERRSNRLPRRASSETLYFPTKELEEFLDRFRADRPGDAIVFPGNAVKQSVINTEFGYGPHNGPHTWTKKFPSCGGNRQSPIDIDLDIAKLPPTGVETALFFKNYNAPPALLTVGNSGHSLRMTGNWSTERRPRVSGFVLPGEYALEEVHFHWGENNEEGSEHLIQGYRYPMEMHVVNYKTTYGSFEEARTKKDGLAVISYLFEIQGKINAGLQKLIVAAKELVDPASPGVSIDPFTLDKLVPPFTRKYASYFGSLTTPPCSEIVTWIVNLEPQFVSSEQIEKLRQLKRSDGTKMLFNFRPVQRLNSRDIINVS